MCIHLFRFWSLYSSCEIAREHNYTHIDVRSLENIEIQKYINSINEQKQQQQSMTLAREAASDTNTISFTVNNNNNNNKMNNIINVTYTQNGRIIQQARAAGKNPPASIIFSLVKQYIDTCLTLDKQKQTDLSQPLNAGKPTSQQIINTHASKHIPFVSWISI